MPTFSRRSLSELETCHVGLQRLAFETLKYLDFSITCGVRSKSEQNRLYVLRLTKQPWPSSKHNVLPEDWERGERSLAFDFAPYPLDHFPDPRNNPETYIKDIARWYMYVQAFKIIAQQLELPIRCGADWDMDGDILDQTFDDLGHIELLLPKEEK